MLFVCALLFPLLISAQGATCADMQPFCTDSGVNFPASTDNGVSDGIGCFNSVRHPAWYYFQIDQGGDMEVTISNITTDGDSVDIDFIVFGPFQDLAEAHSQCNNYNNVGEATCPESGVCPNGVPCDFSSCCIIGCSNDGECPDGTPCNPGDNCNSCDGNEFNNLCCLTDTGIDCSYRGAETEIANIPSAQKDEVYVLMITNHLGMPTEISANVTGGTATTNCAIVQQIPDCRDVAFFQADPNDSSNFINLPTTIDCTDDPITLVAEPAQIPDDVIPQANDFITPAFGIEIVTDGNSETENTLEIKNFLNGGGPPGFLYDIGAVPNNRDPYVFYGEYINPNDQYSFIWCDNAGTGTFEYNVIDYANGNIMASGTFDHAAEGDCITVNIGTPTGTTNYTGDGIITDVGDGRAVFDPTSLNPGTYNITYSWNDDNGDCMGQQTKSIVVTCTGCAVSGGEIVGDNMIDICADDTSVTLATTNEVTAPDLPAVLWGLWILDDPLNMTPIPAGPIPPDALPFTHANYVGILEEPNGIVIAGPSVIIPPDGTGITYYVAPLIGTISPDGNNGLIDTQCSGLNPQEGYTIYMNPPINVSTNSTNCSFTADISGGYPCVDPTADYSWEYTTPDGSVVTGTGPNIDISANMDVCYTISVTDDDIGCGLSITPPFCSMGCECSADAGTFTNNGEILCIGDMFTMTSNGDYMGSHENGSPSDVVGANSDGDSFNGVGYALFSDTPTGQTIIPGAGQDLNFIGLLGTSPAITGGPAQNAGFSVGDLIDDVPIQVNTTYYVTTVYSFDVDDNIYAVGLDGSPNCFDSNPDQAVPVTFIDSIQTTITQSCNVNGTADISIEITGGLPGFDNTNVYTITSTAGPAGTVPANGTYTISGHPLGELFTVVIGDGLCPSVNIQEFAILGPTVQVTGSTDVSCNGASDGTASILPGSGTQPYTIEWSHGVTESLALTNLEMGTYNVTVTDDLGCFVVSEDIIIEEAESLITSAVADSTSCEGANDGVITATTMGGADPYAYTWEGIGLGTNPQGGFAAGTYAYTVTDNNGCIATGSATIEEPLDPGASITGMQPTCFGTNTGSMEGFGSGGTPPYTFLWSNGQTSQTITDLAVGQYSLTITDSKGCTAEAVETLSQPGMLTVGIQPVSDASCEGSMDGELEATNNNGGTPPYTYTWSHDPTLNSPNATNLNPDTYIVTITDTNGCSDIASETVNQTVNIMESGSIVNDALCNGGEGSITANFTGSTNTPFTYTWSHDATLNSATATELPANVTYTVTVTDAVGCTSSEAFIIDQPSELIFGTNIDSDISCNNENDGEASVINVSGGTEDYAYEWENGQMTATATGLSGGTHLVTVTDANGCFSIDSVTIINPEPLTHIASSGEIECNGGTGSISLIVNGGTPDVAGNYDYQWSANTGGQVAATAVNLVANTPYSYTITDANGCTVAGEQTLVEPALLVATLDSQTNIDCNGNSTGEAIVSATGGEINSPDTDYTFEWSASANNQTGNTATDLPAGTHTVTITDSNECTDTLNINITQPDLLEVSIDIDNNVNCNGEDDGQATAVATGGTVNSPADYTFQWNTNAGNQNTPTATGLMANVPYFVTVTDNNNCIAVSQITLTEPTELSIDVVQDKGVSCNGGSDGEATAMPTGGTPEYSYEWSTGDTTPSVTGLTAEMHYVTITDANNCEAIDSVLIDDVAELAVTVDLGNNVNCNGGSDGSATANPIGGTPNAAGNYTYQWSMSAGDQVTRTATNLPAGTHSVTVTDANNCPATAMIEIEEPDTPLSVSATPDQQVSCNGGSDGSATVIPMGGTPDAAGEYLYEWSVSASGQMTTTATDLPAGTHSVTVTDANGCTDTGEVTITEPTLLEITEIIINNDVSCNGQNDGEATAVATGGTVDSPSGYTFQWDANTGNQTTATATGLMADIEYFVTVTDNNNCPAIDSIRLTQPTPITATIDTVHVTCNGFSDGSATANPTGGTPDVNGNYAYQWSANAGGVFTQTASNLPAGDYTVTITDDNNCPTVEAVTINEPPLLTLSISDTLNVSCNEQTDGTATVTPMGGTPPYLYEWGGSGETDSTAVLLPAGVHIVTVTDLNNCVETAEITITEPDELLVSLQDGATNPSCFDLSDGVIIPTIEGGTPPYTYAWSDGQTTEVADSLSGVNHSLIVTDANGCTANDNITLIPPPQIILQVNTQQTLCRESCDGAASVIANGGAGGFTYLWDNGETTDNASALCAGEHTVTVTDISGCEAVDTFNIEPAAPIFPVGFNEEVSCFGGNDGSITLEPTGGIPPYAYEWFAPDGTSLGTDSGPSSMIENLIAGVYTAIITDANGCSQPANITVREPLMPLTLVASGQGTSCNSGDDGFVTVEPTGGTPSYSYQWSAETGFQDTQTALNLPLGTYTVTVTDAKGCMSTAQESINEPSLVGFAASSIPATCFGDANGIIVMENPVGGIPPYMFSLEPDFINADTITTEFYGLEAGLYTVYVKDAGGCVYEQEVVVDQPFEVIVDAGMDETISFGDSVQLFAQINQPPGNNFVLTWEPATGLSCIECDNPIASPLDDITYIVKASDGTCEAFDEITVFVDRDRDVFIPNIFSPNGDGSNDVFMIFGGAGVQNVISFRVYDRWGEMLYEAENFTTNDPAYGWDGMYRDQRLNPGVFVYVAEVAFIDGTILPYKGDVTLVR